MIETAKQHDLQVGDELALLVRRNSGRQWFIHRIDRITPSGRFVCSVRYGDREWDQQVMPDLSVWGGRCICRASIVTEEIRAVVRTRYLSERMSGDEQLTDDQLNRIHDQLNRIESVMNECSCGTARHGILT